jgi:hypothetical protein
MAVGAHEPFVRHLVGHSDRDDRKAQGLDTLDFIHKTEHGFNQLVILNPCVGRSKQSPPDIGRQPFVARAEQCQLTQQRPRTPGQQAVNPTANEVLDELNDGVELTFANQPACVVPYSHSRAPHLNTDVEYRASGSPNDPTLHR